MSIKFRSRLELYTPLAPDVRLMLPDATEVRVKEIVNGENYVTFLYPRMSDDGIRYAALREDAEIRFPPDIERGQRYTIRRVDEVREGLRVYKRVEAHHVAFDLGNYFYDGYIDFAAAKDITEMLGLLGSGTPFSFVAEGNFSKQDIFDWGEDKRFSLLQTLRQLYEAELSFDNYEITLTTRKGANRGTTVRYRHNLAGIQRNSHTMERITRLYGYGKNGLTIEGLPGHPVKYIDSQYFDPNNPFEAKVEFAEIEVQSQLLAEMKKHLAKYELPNVSYNIDYVQLEKIDPDFEPLRLQEAGDTVTVYDDDLGYAFDARAIEYERYPFEPKRGRVTLANFRPMKDTDYIFQATVGSRKAISFTNKQSVLKGQKYDDSVTIADGFGITISDDMNRKRVMLGQYEPGEYGLIVLNKDGDRTIWLDDSGDVVISGTLQAAVINGGIINGAEVKGGVITGALIQTKDYGQYPRIELSSSGNLLTASLNASESIAISPSLTGSPTFLLTSDGQLSGILSFIQGYGLMLQSSDMTYSLIQLELLD